MDEAREGREVQGGLFDASVAKQLEAARDQELGETVRRAMVAPHHRERDGRAAVARDEVKEAADPALGVAPDHDQAVGVLLAPEGVERHREASFGRAVPPAAADRVQLGDLGVGELAEILQARAEALLLESRDRLAHLADRAAVERERPRLDHRLVAEVERAQAELAPQGPQPLAGADHGDSQTTCLRELAPLSQETPDRLVPPNRVAG